MNESIGIPGSASANGRLPSSQPSGSAGQRWLPSDRQIGWFLFFSSLILYLASMSWVPFPGLPLQSLLLHLGLEATPGILDPIWGRLIRLMARLPGLSVAGWAGLFSAICGAATVGLTGRLMVRVGYCAEDRPQASSLMREMQARHLSGLVSGLYLAACIPFWIVSTRSLPATFHVLLLMLAVWAFSDFERRGQLRYLGLLGLVYGLGLTESATFVVFMPLVFFLAVREMLRWRMLLSWRAHGVLWGSLLVGLALHPVNALLLFQQGAEQGLLASPWQALGRILLEQARLIIWLPNQNPGVFVYVMFFSLTTWVLLFTMSHRSPWFYHGGQVLVRLLLLVGLLGALYNASFTPWRMLGMGHLLVTPYLLLAICAGYMAGEFWILGEAQPLLDSVFARRHVRRARRISAVFALSLPLIVLAGGLRNWRVVDGRQGGLLEAAAMEVLDRRDGRDILFATAPLDDALRLEMWKRKEPVRLISLRRTASPVYLANIAAWFSEEMLTRPLGQGDFDTFTENLLLSDAGLARAAVIDLPDAVRPFGYLVPDGFLYRLEPAADRIDWTALLQAQRPFWARLRQMGSPLPVDNNLIRPYQDYLQTIGSKGANNLGFVLAERGDLDGALEAFRAARAIRPKNVSALLNLLEVGRERELPEAAELEAEWTAARERLGGEKWALAFLDGYVWRAQDWVRRGWVWIRSGAPTAAEAARRHLSAADAQADKQAQLLDQAYLRWGVPGQDESYYCSLLIQNEKSTEALLELGRLALVRNDPEAADAYLAEALAMGLPEESAGFDRAMIAYVRGGEQPALDLLRTLMRQTPGDPRVWMALALLADEPDPVQAQALKFLKDRHAFGIGGRLALANVLMSRGQWGEARTELEQAIQLDSNNAQAWELLTTLAQETGNKSLYEAGMRALVDRNPEHYLRYQNEGFALYLSGQLAEAEATFRKGLQRTRSPILLNNLASVILLRAGDLQEALDLVDEALQRDPGHPGILTTRGEICLALGRFEEARLALQEAFKKRGRNNNLLLLLARSYEGGGDRKRASALVNALAKQADTLDATQKIELDALRDRLR